MPRTINTSKKALRALKPDQVIGQKQALAWINEQLPTPISRTTFHRWVREGWIATFPTRPGSSRRGYTKHQLRRDLQRLRMI